MAPLKLNFRSTSQDSCTATTTTDSSSSSGGVAQSADCSQPQAHNQTLVRGGNLPAAASAAESNSSRGVTGGGAPAMEYEDEELARSDRSALLQEGAYYHHQHHHHHRQQQQQHHTSHHQHEQIAYDNPTVHREQIEREETPHKSVPAAGNKETPLSPPPSYDHVLNENRLYARGAGGAGGTDGPPSSSACPHHSPRLDSDEATTQTTQLSESDSDSQYMEQCSCQLVQGDSLSAAAAGASSNMQQHEREHEQQSPEEQPVNYTRDVDADTITLDTGNSYPESRRMLAAWQHSTGQTGSEIEISNKSTKQLYKIMAADGMICQMSGECRCDECQSHYFDCDFDNNEHQKTDGGLGAGTPMFLNEVMHGAACNIL